MRMLLTSNGIREGVIHQALLDLLEGPTADARIVVVVDAMLGLSGDKSTMLEHLDALAAFGWAEFDIVSLFAAPRSILEERLRSADVIYGYGGSNHWLAHAWTSTGLVPLLREVIDEKVYVGHSAGSMIFSQLHEAAVAAYSDQEELDLFELTTATPALPIFDWWFMGHLGESYFPEMTDEWSAERAAALAGPVWYLDDASALIVRDSAATPEVVSSGHWLQFGENGRLVDSR